MSCVGCAWFLPFRGAVPEVFVKLGAVGLCGDAMLTADPSRKAGTKGGGCDKHTAGKARHIAPAYVAPLGLPIVLEEGEAPPPSMRPKAMARDNRHSGARVAVPEAVKLARWNKTRDVVMRDLADALAEEGTQTALAARLQCAISTVSHTLCGRLGIGDAIMRGLYGEPGARQ